MADELRISLTASSGDIEALKRKHAKKLGLSAVPQNSELIAQLRASKSEKNGDLDERLVYKLRKASGRSNSGISVIAIMLPPTSCPYNCAYCPTSEIAPKSYTGYEPAALRARQNSFDPAKQVQVRLRQLHANGHSTGKCELIIMGGTFNALSPSFQSEFVKNAFDAFNARTSNDLQEAMKINETAEHRVVALTVETRPDHASASEIEHLLQMGTTRIELGVQSLDDKALQKAQRGHGVRETIEATRNCKDAFLKVGFHMMPGLFSTQAKDVKMAQRLFSDEAFRPDMLKIYPALVIAGTKLHEMWLDGKYTPYNDEQAAEVVARMKAHVPEYCRIMRVDRDIPTHQITAGVKKTNLRELAKKKCVELGITCRCIRCREIGLRGSRGKVDQNKAELKQFKYAASGGTEFFLSFENEEDNALLGFVRLRKPSNFDQTQTMGIRELRVYGEQVAIGATPASHAVQHRSFGKKLMENAEQTAREQGADEILVTSGVGAKEYYRKLGYSDKASYMAKSLRG